MTRFSAAFASEVRRFRSRSSLLLVLALLPVIAVGLAVVQGATAHDDYAQARAGFEENRAAHYDEERANFVDMRATMGDQFPTTAHDLTKEEFVSGRNFFGGRDEVVSKRYDTRVHEPEAARLVAAALALIAFVLGAIDIGRDWSAGVMAGLLVWHPRRVHVLIAKLAVLAPALLAAGVLAFVLVGLGGMVDGSLRGTTQGVTPSWWADQAWFAARACVVGVLCGWMGAAIADLVRNASVPLGVVVAVLVLNPVVGSLAPAGQPWLPVSLIQTVLAWGHRFRTFDGTQLATSVWVSGATAAVVLLATTALLFGAASVVRLRRDVV